MEDKLLQAMVAMGTAVVSLAIIAVLVSNSSNTAGVLQSMFSGYGSILGVAVSPITGGGTGTANV